MVLSVMSGNITMEGAVQIDKEFPRGWACKNLIDPTMGRVFKISNVNL
jgi:hypothetical protein